MRSLVVVAFSASALALPLAAQTMTGQPSTGEPTASSAPGAPSAARNNPTPLAHAGTTDANQVCKTYTPAGTRFSKKECHTQAEWDQMAADARSNLNDTSRNPGGPH
ncbi:MAG: hypothetical protein WA840_00745 [Caulobacteraceae bacterium]